MNREALAAAYDLESSFNNLVLTLGHDANLSNVIYQLDELLGRYGGNGAIARKDQVSNWFVMNAIDQPHSNGIYTQIIAGVLAGERVVVHPGEQVRDGVPVEARFDSANR